MQKKSFSKGKEIILTVLYYLIFTVMVYKIVTARSAAELILFLIPAVCCVCAVWSSRRNILFDRVWNLVHRLCQPDSAKAFLEKKTFLTKKGPHTSGARLLYAFSLMDCGLHEEFRKYVTEDAKELFGTPGMKEKTAYLMFLNAFLQENSEVCESLYTELDTCKSVFESGENGSLSPAWRTVQGDFDILKGDYLKAEKAYSAISEASLSTNREKAYYFYGLARIALGRGNLTAARENLDLAQKYGAGLHAVKTLQIPEVLICEA